MIRNAAPAPDPRPITPDELRHGRGLTELANEDGKVMRDAWLHSALWRAADRIEKLEAEVARLSATPVGT